VRHGNYDPHKMGDAVVLVLFTLVMVPTAFLACFGLIRVVQIWREMARTPEEEARQRRALLFFVIPAIVLSAALGVGLGIYTN
jgi:hypothetical protein